MAIIDLTDDLRISSENPESIKARLLADVNAGVDPTTPAYVDNAPGGIWDDLEGCGALETDRLYDRLNRVALAAIPATSWGAFLDGWAVSLGLARKDAAFAGGTVTFTGSEGDVIASGSQASVPQTSADTEPVSFETTAGGTIDDTGSIDLPVRAVVAGSAGNVPAATVTINDTGSQAVTNAAAMTGGADIETDDALRVRVLRRLASPSGPGNVDYYINIALNYPGVGFVTVQPNTPSVGHVTILIRDVNGAPMPDFAVDGLKALVDPSADEGQGAGLAPIGATVVVAAPTTLAVTIAADVTLETGFTLDGAGGTRIADIEASLSRYVNLLPAGGDPLRTKVIAAIVDVVGVVDLDTSTLELNGSTTGDVAVSATEIASLSTVTIAAS